MIGHAWHGIHVAPKRSEVEPLDWSAPTPRTRRVRERRHTCVCEATAFEFCQAGSLAFMRRLVLQPDRSAVVHETPWLGVVQMERVWSLLLHGRAR